MDFKPLTMKNSLSKIYGFVLKKYLGILTILLMVFLMQMLSSAQNLTGFKSRYISIPGNSKQDSIVSKEAFKKVYGVLMHPRCVNCHPAGDIPLQGDDSHLHTMLPRRGKDGRGMYAMKCANCHQSTNTKGKHTPPGNPVWHLPPADMKMVFQGKSANELAKQLVDRTKNGDKDLEALLEHAEDTLVKSGFNPAEGLELPPLSHEEFKKAWTTWITNGAYAPDEEK